MIQENDWFFQRIQSELAAGEPTGWDLMVITNGVTLTKLKELDYLLALPTDLRPNFEKYAGAFVKSPSYDPGNEYTMAWQSGITGIAYDPALTGRPVTSLQDLFDPKFKGRIGMFGDNQDLPNLTLLAIGVAPETSTPEDWDRAVSALVKQRAEGLVSRYYQQNYIPALANGDVALTMAWSGDIFSAKLSGKIAEGIEFVVPQEGALIWTDNMCIPRGAQHLSDAIAYMDYVYEPRVAAQIAPVGQLHHPRAGGEAVAREDGGGVRRCDGGRTPATGGREPAGLPDARRYRPPSHLPRAPHGGRGSPLGCNVPQGLHVVGVGKVETPAASEAADS